MLALVAFVQVRLKEQFNSEQNTKINAHHLMCVFSLLSLNVIMEIIEYFCFGVIKVNIIRTEFRIIRVAINIAVIFV